MSSIKRYMEQMEEEEAMNEWLRDNVDWGVKEGDPEWEEAKERYLSGDYEEEVVDFWDDDDDYYQDEITRLNADGVAYRLFVEQLTALKNELPENPSASNVKMTYSYSVTLMETCLGDMIKSLIISDDYFLNNAINNVDELSKARLTLKDVYSASNIVNKTVVKIFSDYLYHNVEKIVPIYSAVLGEKTPQDVKDKVGGIVEITKVRHDIVHRNGVDKEGIARVLNQQVLLEAMAAISEFVQSVSTSIDAAKANREPEF